MSNPIDAVLIDLRVEHDYPSVGAMLAESNCELSRYWVCARCGCKKLVSYRELVDLSVPMHCDGLMTCLG